MRDPLVAGVSQIYSNGAVNRGFGGALQQWFESNFDPACGYTTRVGYESFDWIAAQNIADYFTAQGVSANLKNEHGKTTLTLSDATGNYVIDKWELSVDREQPDMFENPLFLSLMNTAASPQTAISMLRSALKNDNDQLDPITDVGWFRLVRTLLPTYYYTVGTGILDPAATTYAPNPDKTAAKFMNALGAAFYGAFDATGVYASSPNMIKLKQYFDAYQLGVTNFLRGKYRLRHTSNIPARWNVSVADFNVEKIYTISQLIAECTGGGFIYPLPNYLSYKILHFVPDAVAAWTPYYVWGALKEKSDAQTAANNRVEITTEFLIDNINSNLYLPI